MSAEVTQAVNYGIPESIAQRRQSLFNISVSTPRLLAWLAYCFVLAASFPWMYQRLAHPDFLFSLILAYLLGALIPFCGVFGRRIDLVEPIYWFAAKYYLVFPGALYFLATGFAFSEHLIYPGREQLVSLAEMALVLFIVGYISFLLGYLVLMRERGPRLIRLPSSRNMSSWVARLVILFCIAIGVLNFAYLLFSYPGGPIAYLMDFGQRGNRFEDIAGPVTTFGYQFLYAGVFLWLALMIRNRTLGARYPESFVFFLVVILSVIVSLSQGRLSQSISYILILAALGYIFSKSSKNNLRFSAIAVGGLFGGIVLYFLRRVSAGTFGDVDTVSLSGFGEQARAFLPALGYWLVDKGNVPNLAVVINLLEQNGLNGHHWFGMSFAVAFTKMSSLLGDLPNIGESAATAWFNGGGGLPPTIIGEMYLNFGVIGVPTGLFAVGLFSSWFYNAVRRNGSFIIYIVHVALLFKFFFLWPKGESSNIVGAFWQFMPALLVYLVIRAISRTVPPARTYSSAQVTQS